MEELLAEVGAVAKGRCEMKMFRKFWGAWPEWFGSVDGGTVVYVRIRHCNVYVGEGRTEHEASTNAELAHSSDEYMGVAEAVDALRELHQKGYLFVPQTEA